MDDPEKKAEIVHQLVKRVPGFAPGWKELAALSANDAESLLAIERGLAANPDGETKGILQVNRALILNRTGDRERATRLLGKLALDPASTYATEHMARFTLAQVLDIRHRRSAVLSLLSLQRDARGRVFARTSREELIVTVAQID